MEGKLLGSKEGADGSTVGGIVGAVGATDGIADGVDVGNNVGFGGPATRVRSNVTFDILLLAITSTCSVTSASVVNQEKFPKLPKEENNELLGACSKLKVIFKSLKSSASNITFK